MSNFTDLKADEYIWVVYDLNWDKNNPSKFEYYPSEYKLDKYLILENNINVARERDISDRYEKPEYVIDYENWIKVNINGKIYSRFYTNHYNEYQHMPIHCEYTDNGPWVELFPDYESAKEYLIEKCNSGIEASNKIIEKENYQIELLKKSLEQIK